MFTTNLYSSSLNSIFICTTILIQMYSGVIQRWNEEGHQYLRRYGTDEVNVQAEIAQCPSQNNSRHDAPLR